ncbi:MAG TPA: ribonuclease Y [Chloroflexota bacterium]|nr:ribonuclease Y [Chloroflexota bacterium]
MDVILIGIVGLVTLAVGFGAGYALRQRSSVDPSQAADAAAEKLLAEAAAKEKEILLQAKDEAIQIRTAAETDSRERRAQIQQQEKRLQQKEESLDQRLTQLDQRERACQERDREAEALERRAEALGGEQVLELERVSGLSREEARGVIVAKVKAQVEGACARRLREIELEAKEEAEARARQVIGMAIQRYSSDQVTEATVSVVHIPNEEMKGRIIGREGRNIRALEAATGIDLIIDDTPDAVTLSGFDPVRREIARLALTKLVTDGRIHPARIEEIVAKAKQEVEAHIRQEGEAAAYEAGVHGLHPEVVKVMGRMKFRTSYGQNQLQHSVEVAHLAAMMAAELGADVAKARRGAFLHDIGKVLTQEVEGPHHIIGADFVRRFGEIPEVCQAISGHHDHDPEYQSIEAVIVQAADAISGARPGARRESVEHYVKRLEALESVANSFEGVEKSFAIQAGREVRIIVKPEEIDDMGAVRLARDIVKRIEETLQYPGQVKVTVVRETRAVDYAR